MGRRRHPARAARIVSLGLSTTAAVGLIGTMHASAAAQASRKKAVADAVARALESSPITSPSIALPDSADPTGPSGADASATAGDPATTAGASNLPPTIEVPTTLAAIPAVPAGRTTPTTVRAGTPSAAAPTRTAPKSSPKPSAPGSGPAPATGPTSGGNTPSSPPAASAPPTPAPTPPTSRPATTPTTAPAPPKPYPPTTRPPATTIPPDAFTGGS